VTGIAMPAFDKRRFQRGALAEQSFAHVFPHQEGVYRKAFAALYE
jgi:asparagine synthase (glutamine-hydrolysing)